MTNNVILLPPRAVGPHTAAAAALELAELNRQMSINAAALYVDTLRSAILRCAPERCTPDNVASLLATLAAEIRNLNPKDAR